MCAEFLVLDTNVWVYETRLLSTGVGSAILFAARQTGFEIAVPEVIEGEVAKQTLKLVDESIRKIQDEYRKIQQLMGARDDYRVPDLKNISGRFTDRINELGDLVIRTAFTKDQAWRAAKRVLDERPPNSPKSQQFKDSAIWETIVDLAERGNVDFVTRDKAFFEGSRPELGLDAILKNEISTLPNQIRIFESAEKYLEVTQGEKLGLVEAEIVESINELILPCLREHASTKGFVAGELSESTAKSWLTETVDKIAVKFDVTYKANATSNGDTDQQLTSVQVTGECFYDPKLRRATEPRLGQVMVYDQLGNPMPGLGVMYGYVEPIIIGRQTIPYRLSHSIAIQ
jgi:hypothetical protein